MLSIDSKVEDFYQKSAHYLVKNAHRRLMAQTFSKLPFRSNFCANLSFSPVCQSKKANGSHPISHRSNEEQKYSLVHFCYSFPN